MNNFETWKDIKGYIGLYQISNYGNVKSLNFSGSGEIKILRKRYSMDGYVLYILYKDKKRKTKSAHRLVYENFVGSLKEGMVIDHIDNDNKNNYYQNLQQITRRENSNKDKFRYNKTSKYRGVSWSKSKGKWRAQITFKNKNKHLGYKDVEIEAYKLYLKALSEHEY